GWGSEMMEGGGGGGGGLGGVGESGGRGVGNAREMKGNQPPMLGPTAKRSTEVHSGNSVPPVNRTFAAHPRGHSHAAPTLCIVPIATYSWQTVPSGADASPTCAAGRRALRRSLTRRRPAPYRHCAEDRRSPGRSTSHRRRSNRN